MSLVFLMFSLLHPPIWNSVFPTDSLNEVFTINEVIISGNIRTKESIIRRELTFKTGDEYKLSDFLYHIERSRQNIFNSSLFLSVKSGYIVEGNNIIVEYDVREKLYLVGLPILYLADRSFNEWWYDRNRDIKRITFGLQLNHNNLTGNNDKLRIKAYGGFIPYFELSYGRPYIDRRQRMGLRGGVFFSAQKNLPYRTWNDKLDFLNSDLRTRERKGVFAEYKLRNALYHFHTIYIGATNQSISDTISKINPDYLGNQIKEINYLTFSYDYLFDRRDNNQYPLKGQVWWLNFTQYGLGIVSKYQQSNLELRYYKYFKIVGKTFADFNLRGKVSTPQRQLYPFVRGFGYSGNLVRGYQLNVVDGQHYALLQTNLKQQLFKRQFNFTRVVKIKSLNAVPISIFARAFYDLGFVKNYYPELSNSILSNKLLSGYGLGFDLVTFLDTSLNINYSRNQTGFGKFYLEVKRGL